MATFVQGYPSRSPVGEDVMATRTVFSFTIFSTSSMNKVISENDEPIHHFEGKNLLRSCPSKLTSALSGESSSPISSSPPDSNFPGQQNEPKGKTQSKVKRVLAKIFKRDNSKQQISITVLNFTGNIVFEDSTLIDESTIIETLTKQQQDKQL